MHLTALRALGDDVPVNLKLIVEGSEEQGTGGLEDFVPKQRRPAARRRDPGLRHRQRRGRRAGRHGQPARHGQRRGARSRRCRSEVHSGMFGGAAPDALAALVAHAGDAARRGRQHHDRRPGQHARPGTGAVLPGERFRADAGLLDGASLLGDGTVSDMIWARPAVTVLGIDCPPVVGSAAAIQPRARPGSTCGCRRAWTRTKAHDALDRPPARGRAVGRPGDGRDGGARSAVPGRTGGPGVPRMRARHARRVRPGR